MTDKPIINPKKATNNSAASLSITVRDRFAFEVDISHGGLALLGSLVTGILLSTSVIIVAARRNRRTAAASLPMQG